MTVTFSALPARNKHSNEMLLHTSLLLPSFEDKMSGSTAAILPLWGQSQRSVDDRASKQKEMRLNECERLKAPKQFPCSGQGFFISNSQSLLSEH